MMFERQESRFGQVAKHAAAQMLLTKCMGQSLRFVSDLLQGHPANCSATISFANDGIVENGLLTTEQVMQLHSRCIECRQALNSAADAWKKRDRDALSAHLNTFRDAQGRMRRAIVAVAG